MGHLLVPAHEDLGKAVVEEPGRSQESAGDRRGFPARAVATQPGRKERVVVGPDRAVVALDRVVTPRAGESAGWSETPATEIHLAFSLDEPPLPATALRPTSPASASVLTLSSTRPDAQEWAALGEFLSAALAPAPGPQQF